MLRVWNLLAVRIMYILSTRIYQELGSVRHGAITDTNLLRNYTRIYDLENFAGKENHPCQQKLPIKTNII